MQIGQCYLQLKWGTGDPAVAAKHFLLAQDIYTNQKNFARLTHNPRYYILDVSHGRSGEGPIKSDQNKRIPSSTKPSSWQDPQYQ